MRSGSWRDGSRNGLTEALRMDGDGVMLLQDGYFWFFSRVDDLIISSGYRIGGTVNSVYLKYPIWETLNISTCAIKTLVLLKVSTN